MRDLGHFSLCLAWALSLVATLSGAWAGLKKQSHLGAVARQASLLTGVLGAISICALAWLFVTDDYRLQYVWQYSNHDMTWWYKITAIWGGMDGSMLLWAFLLGVGGAILARRAGDYPPSLMPWTFAIYNSASLFFFTVVVFMTNPFTYLIGADSIPPDGNGLNPLLQNTFMAIHPPIMYLGFTLFALPFAFCMGALLSGQVTEEWLKLTRRYSVVAWIFLTTGIVLGGFWAYIELGWGGFWAWDPVENSSFHPWLTGTAFLHGAIVQERKKILRMWNVWLISITYTLTVFGTFLTRSGIVQSVHAFASTDIGWIFMLYLALLILGTLVLTVVYRKRLAPESMLESLFCRETAIFMGNLVLLSICFSVVWGVMFPVLSEGIAGSKQTVSAPFFNAVTIPQFFILLALMGMGPLIAWRRANVQSVLRTFMAPFLVAVVATIVLVASGIRSAYPLIAYFISIFAMANIIADIRRGLRARKAAIESVSEGEASYLQVVGAVRRRRYGAHIVHFGVALAAISITSAMAFKMEVEFALGQGETHKIGKFDFTLKNLEELQTPTYQALRANVDVKRTGGGAKVDTLQPESRFYLSNKQPTSEIGLHVGVLEDIYLVLAGLDEKGQRATFKVFINPLQVWLWVATFVMVLGGFVALLPEVKRSWVQDGN